MEGPPLLKVTRKLQRLKNHLRYRNRHVFGKVDVNLRRLEDEYELAMKNSDKAVDDFSALKVLNDKELKLIVALNNKANPKM